MLKTQITFCEGGDTGVLKSDMGYNRKNKHFQSIIYFYIETKRNGKKNVTIENKKWKSTGF